MSNIGKAVYGVVDRGVYGLKVYAGIVIGVEFTEDLPIFTILSGNNKVKTTLICYNKEEVLEQLNLTPLERIQSINSFKLKYK